MRCTDVTAEAPDTARSVPPNVPPAQFQTANDVVVQDRRQHLAEEQAETAASDPHDETARPGPGAVQSTDHLESAAAESLDRQLPSRHHAAVRVPAAANEAEQQAASHQHRPVVYAQEQIALPAQHTPQVKTTTRSDRATAKAATPKSAACGHE